MSEAVTYLLLLLDHNHLEYFSFIYRCSDDTKWTWSSSVLRCCELCMTCCFDSCPLYYVTHKTTDSLTMHCRLRSRKYNMFMIYDDTTRVAYHMYNCEINFELGKYVKILVSETLIIQHVCHHCSWSQFSIQKRFQIIFWCFHLIESNFQLNVVRLNVFFFN